MPFERTDAGLSTQTLAEIRAELVTAFTDPSTGIDPDLDMSDNSALGRLVSIVAEREYDLQQQILAVYNDLGAGASGDGLTKVALLTGTVRRDETFSTVTLSLTLGASVTVPALSEVSDSTGQALFRTNTAVASAGAGTYTVAATAVEPGPVAAPAATLTTIVKAVPGWTAVTNPTAAVPGESAETDAELRRRRIDELNSAASAHLQAIVTAVRGVANVVAATGYENVTNSTDVDGLLAHSFEIVVRGASLVVNEVSQAIWDNHPAGIGAVHGTAGTQETGVAVDSEGTPHFVVFTRADETPVYVRVDLQYNVDLWPADGVAQVQAAVTAAIEEQASSIGDDVLYSRLFAPVYGIPGVRIVTLMALDTSPAPTLQQNIVIGSRAVPAVGTVTVNATAA